MADESVVEALDRICAALGGDPGPSESIVEALDCIRKELAKFVGGGKPGGGKP